MKDKKKLVEIWGDVVEIKALVFSIGFTIVTTMSLYLLAPSNDETIGLFFGLAGSIIGFIVSAIMIEPKRDITVEEKE